MGIYRLLFKSIIFSTRSKRRFIPFVIVFGILSGATIILLYNFDNFSREGLLVHSGVVIKASSMDSVTLSDAESDIGVTDGGSHGLTKAVIFYKYVNFGGNIRIFSMRPKYSWAFDAISPTDLVAGTFPRGNNDVLVPEDALLTLADAQDPVNIYTKFVVGTTIKIGKTADSEFDLRVSGVYKKPTAVASDNREWIFITEEAFKTLTDAEHLNYDSSQIYIHSISILASGDYLSGNVYNNVDNLYAEFSPDIDPLPQYDDVDHTPKSLKEGGRSFSFLSLLFGMFGTFMVSTLYSYLITRFRRREVAVLKAMGYSKLNVRIVVLSEILVVAITGYIIGLLVIQGYLWNPLGRSGAYYYLILLSPTALFAFIAVVISCVPGFFLITFRILSVRPIEIFRQK
ncbi:MAG: ABC transporter permease [Promethearchaeota archaeon]